MYIYCEDFHVHVFLFIPWFFTTRVLQHQGVVFLVCVCVSACDTAYMMPQWVPPRMPVPAQHGMEAQQRQPQPIPGVYARVCTSCITKTPFHNLSLFPFIFSYASVLYTLIFSMYIQSYIYMYVPTHKSRCTLCTCGCTIIGTSQPFYQQSNYILEGTTNKFPLGVAATPPIHLQTPQQKSKLPLPRLAPPLKSISLRNSPRTMQWTHGKTLMIVYPPNLPLSPIHLHSCWPPFQGGPWIRN